MAACLLRGSKRHDIKRTTGRRVGTLALWLASACAVLLLGAPLAAAAAAAPDRLIVGFADGVSAARERALAAGADGKVTDRLPSVDASVVRLDPGQDLAAAARELEASPLVAYAEPDYRIHVQRVPNDPLFGRLYGLDNSGQYGGIADADIDAPEAWEATTGGDVVVAVTDSGVDQAHPDLAGNLWANPAEVPGNGNDDDHDGFVDDVHGANFMTGSGDPSDDNGHGTLVSGVIAAQGDNGIGVTGVAWRARVMALKFLGANGTGYTSDAVDAVAYAQAHGARVINASWAGSGQSYALEQAIANAGRAGILFVGAAGNEGRDIDVTPTYPAAYPEPSIVSVAATGESDQLASYSNYGRASVDLAAPGDAIVTTAAGGGYAAASGTSLATPFVTGTAALVLSRAPDLTAEQVRDRLLGSVDRLPQLANAVATGGRLNAAGAVQAAPSGAPPKDATRPRARLTGRGRYSLRRVLRRGIPVSCQTDEAATCRIVVRLRRGWRVLGGTSITLDAAGTRSGLVRPTRSAARALRRSRARRVRVVVSATVTDPAGNASAARRLIVVRR